VLTSKNAKASQDLDWVLDQLQLDKHAAVGASQHTDQEAHLAFGPRWQLLRDTRYEAGESAAMLYLDDQYAADLEHYKVHPAILDIATGYAMSLIEGYSADDSQLWVPVSYASFIYQRPLTQKVFTWVRNSSSNSVSEGFASFDVTIFDEAGNLLVEVKKLTIKRLEGEIDFASGPPAGGLEKDDSLHESGDAEFRQLSPAELAFQHNLSQGILPKEGSEALIRVLQYGKTPEIIVSSLDLEGLIKEVDATAAANTQEDEGAKFARPDLDSDFVEARDDIERTLVGFWEDLLGVDQVGVEDSFFDLGGHSLVAVRLFAKIQQAYGVDYPISVLFEAPTISACAEMLREVVGDQQESDASGEAKESAPKTARYRHLVPMHSSKSSSKTPFFLVAGMFGNVLNLRHLAQLIGSERPFYGLQARGLLGEETPHETFEDAAADYINEMLTVQEDGPFILGGFSGGGITAYEIARQLRERGKEVAEIILLDTPLPYHDPISSVDKMSIHWQRIRSKGFGYFSEWAKDRYYWELNKFKKRFGDVNEPDLSPAEFKSGVIEAAFYRSLGRYEIEAMDIKTKLFRPKLPVEYRLSGGRVANSDRQLITEDNGWSRYVKDLEVFEVPGNHDSMVLEPNVRVLATKMRQCIDDADQ
jgi:thioesterase domain-containing protein/acyl carrier protein